MLKLILSLISAMALLSSAQAAPLDDARADIEAGKWRQAEIALKGVLQEDPSMIEARWLLARVYLLRHDGAAAQHELERAISQGASRDELLVPLARALIFQGKGERVPGMVEPLEQVPPARRAELLAVKGLAELSGSDISAAEADLKQSLALAPDGQLARYGLARIAAAERDWTRARELVDEALEKHPESSEGWELLATIEIGAGQTDAGLQALNQALRRAPQSAVSHFLRAQLLLDRKQPDEAEKDILALRGIAPGTPALSLLQGRLAFARNQIEDGLQSLEQYLRAAPKAPVALYLASIGHYRQGRLSHALEYAQRLHAVAPGSVQANALLAAIALAEGDVDGADARLSALPLDTELPLVDALRLRVAIAKGRLDEAVDILDQRIAQADADDPARQTNQLLRLRVLGAMGNWQAVRDEVEPMVAEHPEDPLLTKMRLEAMLRTEDAPGALAAARTWTERAPEDTDAHTALAKILARTGDVEGSRAAFNEALRLDPENAGAAMALARLEADSGNLGAARESLQALVQTSPDTLGAILGLASLDLAEGQPSAAESRLGSALERTPKNLTLRINLAATQARQGDTAGALRTLQDATPEQSGKPQLLRARGGLELAAGQSAQAARTFEQLREQRPDAAAPALLLVLAKARAGQLMGIEDLMAEALQLGDDNSALAAATLQTVFKSLPDTASRKRLLERIERVAPSSVAFRVLAAGMALKQQDKASAISHLQAAHAAAPQRRPILDKLVALLNSDGRTEEALRLMRSFVRDQPDDARARATLATIELQRGRRDAAIAEYRKVLEIDRKQPETLNNLAMLTMDEDPAGALSMAREAMALNPSDWRIVDTLAIALMRTGSPEEAAEVVGQARVGQPNNPTLAYRLAAALAQSGDPERARKLLLEIGQRSFPERAEADALLSRLTEEGSR